MTDQILEGNNGPGSSFRGTGGMDRNLLLHTYRLMYSVKMMAETYEANRAITKYVHSTSRGHEAIQLATAFHLLPQDWVSPYYRDESLLLGMGWTPYELMLQLLTKEVPPRQLWLDCFQCQSFLYQASTLQPCH